MNTCFKTLISIRELQSLAPARVALIDCRFDLGNPRAGLEAYLAAHIPGARYADLNEDLSAPVTQTSGRHPLPEPAKLRRRLAELGVEKTKQTVAYDAGNGSFAARAWWLARWLGLANVAVLDGGFAAWSAAGGAVESGMAPAPAVRSRNVAAESAAPASAEAAGASGFGPGALDPGALDPGADEADRGAWLSSQEVLAALSDPARLLIDARAPERYSGKVEPLDPVAGHVAGAVNFPFSGNLDAEGRFLPPDRLRERWLARLGPIRAGNAIMMCGSGVTACHNVLAVEHAGLGTPKLYAGSWSEWIKDPSRPIARD